MDIKKISLTQLETNLRGTLNEFADSGNPLLVELSDHRIIAIQPMSAMDDDSLIDELLTSNPAFQALAGKSKAGSREPFVARFGQ